MHNSSTLYTPYGLSVSVRWEWLHLNCGIPQIKVMHIIMHTSCHMTSWHMTTIVDTSSTGRGCHSASDGEGDVCHMTGEVGLDESPQGINDVTKYFGGVLLHVVTDTERPENK